MKIGMIGIGDIARKAYLPILAARSDVELVIASRNQQVVAEIARQYRIPHTAVGPEEMMAHGVEAAFVHAATEAHPAIVRQLLEAGIHVFVDKPIAYTLDTSAEIISLAKERGVRLMVGFNRRFAPLYVRAKEEAGQPDVVLMQKNRTGPLSDVRTTIFDDFIHVVDTLLHFLPYPEEVDVYGKMQENQLLNVTITLSGGGTQAIGMMNRHTGLTEEILEVTGHRRKWRVEHLTEMTRHTDAVEERIRFGDWTPTLERRGFTAMIDHFLASVRNEAEPINSGTAALKTHEICEQIVTQLTNP